MPYLHMLGFEVIGYGCSACVENASTQPLIPPNSIVCCGTLSGNRNFEGRLVPGIHANYLASPPLVIAYAIAGKILKKIGTLFCIYYLQFLKIFSIFRSH